MAPRYRKVSLRIWTDAKVRRLTPPPPNGLSCFQYLLTARESTNIPGLIPAGSAALAESLRWSFEGFQEAFAEVFREGLAKADWTAGLVWIPKAIRHNEPENPNVVKHWAETWDDLIPECELKLEAYETLRAYCASRGDSFLKAFDDSISRPSLNHHERVTERVQETLPQILPETMSPSFGESGTGTGTGEKALAPASRTPASKKVPDPRHHPLKLKLLERFRARTGREYGFLPKDAKAIATLLALCAEDAEILRRWEVALGMERYPGTADLNQFAERWNLFAGSDPPRNVVREPRDPNRKTGVVANAF